MIDSKQLNQALVYACLQKPPDFALAEELLRKGANPMGVFMDGNYRELVYSYLRFYLENDEYFYYFTELFLRFGLDLSKPEQPYDDDELLHPLLYYFIYSEWKLKTLRLLLDHGLAWQDANICWVSCVDDFVNCSGSLSEQDNEVSFSNYIRMIFLIASYPEIIRNDIDLQNHLWCSVNSFDLTRFRNWDWYRFEIDTSHCNRIPEVYRSVVTIFDCNTGKQVWKFGVDLSLDTIQS